MLAPPDEQIGSDKGALEGAGKERYLRSLGKRRQYVLPLR